MSAVLTTTSIDLFKIAGRNVAVEQGQELRHNLRHGGHPNQH